MGQIIGAARLLPWLFVIAVGGVVAAQSRHETSAAERFLAALTGSWTGMAELTPIGPRPYDITFTGTADGRVEGHANPGRATHYWRFYKENEQMHLRFMSTFAGNRDPILLHAGEFGPQGVLFRAKDPPLLSVRLLPGLKRLNIDVFHWDRLHVSIRLRRS